MNKQSLQLLCGLYLWKVDGNPWDDKDNEYENEEAQAYAHGHAPPIPLFDVQLVFEGRLFMLENVDHECELPLESHQLLARVNGHSRSDLQSSTSGRELAPLETTWETFNFTSRILRKSSFSFLAIRTCHHLLVTTWNLPLPLPHSMSHQRVP